MQFAGSAAALQPKGTLPGFLGAPQGETTTATLLRSSLLDLDLTTGLSILDVCQTDSLKLKEFRDRARARPFWSQRARAPLARPWHEEVFMQRLGTDVAMHAASKKHASNLQCKEKQHRLQQFFCREDSDVIRAECLFTGFLLEHNIPLGASEHDGPLLRKMFPKSDVAKSYACSRTKTTAIVGEMARHAQGSTVSALKKGVFSVAIDGSNDNQAQLLVRPGLLKEHKDLLRIDYKSRGAQRDDEDIVTRQEPKYIVDRLLPTLLPVEQQESKDEALNFLEMEYVKLQAFDIPPDVLQEEQADVQWNTISHIKGAVGLLKFGPARWRGRSVESVNMDSNAALASEFELPISDLTPTEREYACGNLRHHPTETAQLATSGPQAPKQ
ncbi:hypothetical protein HPB47_027103 [Ixodes persulcatus]|uniref:Uncharacterized protein n=1 Tax=Ixodes persulcatus TaxID=34615 RepID=A0AC60PZ71_IXOPE|nr:hypothetical protein HPB47_027103 [Ixodes persulcatus]